jgi:uncharacterized sulfatase
VLWISTHDINPDLGCYAGVWPQAGQARTPHLDRLAGDGIRFDQAFAAAPVCGPSRSAILTGCFPPAIGTMHMRTRATTPDDVRLLPQYFREGGYWTGNSSFTDFQVEIPAPVFDQLGKDAHWRNREDPDQPFFMAFHGLVTHESQIYLDDVEFARVTADLCDDDRIDPTAVRVPPYHPDTQVFRRSWARYLELVQQMDHWVGAILADLEQDGLADDTIVVFWSDHGLGMPRAKRWATEAGLREPLIVRWPGRVASGSTYAAPVALMDLAPTMLTMCGLPVPGHMHGEPLIDAHGSLVPDRRGWVVSARDRVGEQEDTSRTIRDERFRYIRHLHPDRSSMQHCDYPDHLATWSEFRRLHANEAQQELSQGQPPSILTSLQRSVVAASKPAEELYDLSADPHEERNLATDPAFATDLARLSDLLDDWLGTVGDLGALPESTLLESWRPGGERPVTETPTIDLHDGRFVAQCTTPGAVIGWTATPPSDADPSEAPFSGDLDDGRRWRLASTGLPDPGSQPRLWLKAWRIGYSPSDDVLVEGKALQPTNLACGA